MSDLIITGQSYSDNRTWYFRDSEFTGGFPKIEWTTDREQAALFRTPRDADSTFYGCDLDRALFKNVRVVPV